MKKLNAFLFKIFCFVSRITIVNYANFPEGFKKTLQNNLYGVFSEKINDWIAKINYSEIIYDEPAKLFVGKIDKITYLIDFEGKILFQTAHNDLSFMGNGIGITQELVSNKDGTFKYISRNTLAGNGWTNTVNSKGQILGEFISFELEA